MADDFGLDLSDAEPVNPQIDVVLFNLEHAEITRKKMDSALFAAMHSTMPVLWKGRTFLFAYGTANARAYVETPVFKILD